MDQADVLGNELVQPNKLKEQIGKTAIHLEHANLLFDRDKATLNEDDLENLWHIYYLAKDMIDDLHKDMIDNLKRASIKVNGKY